MRVESPSICVIILSIGFASARSLPVDPSAKERESCGSPNAPGIWRMEGDCPRGLEDWMTKGGSHSELDCCYSIPCSGTESSGVFQGYCMSTNADGNFNAPKDYEVKQDSRCKVQSGRGNPVVTNGDLSFNPSNTPGRCVALASRHSDASGVGETGYVNPVGTDQLEAFNQPMPDQRPETGEEMPGNVQALPGDKYGGTTAQAAAAEQSDGFGGNFDDFE